MTCALLKNKHTVLLSVLWWDLRPNESQLLRCPALCEGAWREGARGSPRARGSRDGAGAWLHTGDSTRAVQENRLTGSQPLPHCQVTGLQGLHAELQRLWNITQSSVMAQAFMGPSSGATQCLPAARAETNCRSQVASKIPTISWRSTMPKPCHF